MAPDGKPSKHTVVRAGPIRYVPVADHILTDQEFKAKLRARHNATDWRRYRRP